MEHPVVWFEVNGTNGAALRAFYEDAFGWKIDANNPIGYGMVEAPSGRGIPGGIGTKSASEVVQPDITFFVSTTSIDRTLANIEGLGGSVLMPRTVLPGGTIIGMFADLEGHAVGLVEESA